MKKILKVSLAVVIFMLVIFGGVLATRTFVAQAAIFHAVNNKAHAPHIFRVFPRRGTIGTKITILGRGFSTTGDNLVHFGGGVVDAQPSKNGLSLTFALPSAIQPSCEYTFPRCEIMATPLLPGKYKVWVSNSNGSSNFRFFTVLPNPTISPVPTLFPIIPAN